MRRLLLAVALVLGAASRASAQDPGADGLNPQRAEQLRLQIEDRLAARAKEELGLTDEQLQRLRATAGQFGEQRRGVEEQERRLRQAMAFQLRPGIAANPDSVSRLTDALINVKGAYVQTYRDEMHALAGFLNPVQRAQFFMLRERLLTLAQEIRAQRRLQITGDAAPAPLRQRRRP